MENKKWAIHTKYTGNIAVAIVHVVVVLYYECMINSINNHKL